MILTRRAIDNIALLPYDLLSVSQVRNLIDTAREAVAPMLNVRLRSAFVLFTYLQLQDFLTTIAFRMVGIEESNPLIRFSMIHGGTYGLLIAKGLAVALALFAMRRGLLELLHGMNILYAGIVAWNLVALILYQRGI